MVAVAVAVAERVSARLRAEVIVKAFGPFSASKGARPVVDDDACYKFARASLAVSQAGLGARVVLDIFAVDIAEAVGFVRKAVALCQILRRALARAPRYLAPELARHGSLGGAATRVIWQLVLLSLYSTNVTKYFSSIYVLSL